jgi:hypothetical protein
MLKALIYIGFFVRLCVAIWNGFFGPSFGAESDAQVFYLNAVQYSRNLELDQFSIGHFYSYVLGVIYNLSVDSLFIGSLLSVFAWLASAIIFVRCMRLLSIEKSSQNKAMLIYALLPSSVLLTSVTLREVFELLFVNLAIYFALLIYLKKSYMHWGFLFGAVIAMGVLHGALIVSGIFILIATFFMLTLRGRKGFSPARLLLIAPIIAIVLVYGFSVFSTFSYGLEGAVYEEIQTHQEGSLGTDARTNYKEYVNIEGLIDLLIFIPVAIFQYLFEPMPWHMSASIDAVSLLENGLRAWLIWKVISRLGSLSPQDRRVVWFVFLIWAVMETIWSIGVINWGTALRHHIPSLGLLLMAAFSYTSVVESYKPQPHKCFFTRLLKW